MTSRANDTTVYLHNYNSYLFNIRYISVCLVLFKYNEIHSNNFKIFCLCRFEFQSFAGFFPSLSPSLVSLNSPSTMGEREPFIPKESFSREREREKEALSSVLSFLHDLMWYMYQHLPTYNSRYIKVASLLNIFRQA